MFDILVIYSWERMMTRKQQFVTLKRFQQKFRTDDHCRQHLFAIRFPDGLRCQACGHDKYYPIRNRLLFQFVACRHQTSLKAGTILRKTRTPLRIWFWALFLIAHDKHGISALALASELAVSYKTYCRLFSPF